MGTDLHVNIAAVPAGFQLLFIKIDLLLTDNIQHGINGSGNIIYFLDSGFLRHPDLCISVLDGLRGLGKRGVLRAPV